MSGAAPGTAPLLIGSDCRTQSVAHTALTVTDQAPGVFMPSSTRTVHVSAALGKLALTTSTFTASLSPSIL